MADAQSVILLGRLTRDPELRETQSGVVVNFGLAVNRKWHDRDGTPREEVLFIDVAAFGRTAEIVHQYRHRGGEVLCDGYLRLEQWEDRQGGGRRQAIKLVAERIQLVGSDGGTSGGDQRGGYDDRQGGGWMDRDGGGQGYDDRPHGRPGYEEHGNWDGGQQPPPRRDNRTQQGGRQGSVAGLAYPRRDEGRNRAQNARPQTYQNPQRRESPPQRRTERPQAGQRHPESARNDRYGSGRYEDLPPRETSGVPNFDPESDMRRPATDGTVNPDGGGQGYGDTADDQDGGDGPAAWEGGASYEDGEPPAIGGSAPPAEDGGGDHGDMQPLAERFDQPGALPADDRPWTDADIPF